MCAVRRHAQLHRPDVGFERVLERCEHQPLGQHRGALCANAAIKRVFAKPACGALANTMTARSVSFVELGQPFGRRADPVQPAQPPREAIVRKTPSALPATARRRDALAQTHRRRQDSQPPAQLDVFHQRLIGEPSDPHKALAAHEDRLVAGGDAAADASAGSSSTPPA